MSTISTFNAALEYLMAEVGESLVCRMWRDNSMVDCSVLIFFR